MQFKISVIVFTCNRPDDLNHCLESVGKQVIKDFDLLVVVNADDRRTDEILKHYPAYVIKDQTKQLSYLFNLGWKNTRSDFIAYLADDVEIDSLWLKEGLDTLERNAQAAVVTGPLISPFEFSGQMHTLYTQAKKNKFLSLVAEFYNHFILEGKVFEPCILCESGGYTMGQAFRPHFSQEREVDLATTSAMLFRRQAVESICGFDENFFFNHADGDLFVRLKKNGYKIIYNPRMLGKHYNQPGPSRYPFFIGRDTAYFYLKDIRPKSYKGILAALANIIILNLYWIYNFFSLKNSAQLKGISGFLSGVFAFFCSRRK